MNTNNKIKKQHQIPGFSIGLDRRAVMYLPSPCPRERAYTTGLNKITRNTKLYTPWQMLN